MISLTLALLLATTPATSGETAPSTPPVAQAEVKTDQTATEKKICRKVADGMNSRRKVNLCMTATEWRKFNQGD